MFTAARVRRLLGIVFFAACTFWYGKQNVQTAIPTHGPSDFTFYHSAAQHILHGESPFLTPDYIYPPLLACLLLPLAAFDYFTARWIWFVFSHACFLAAGFLLWRRLGRDWIAAGAIAFVWSAGMVAHDGFATGQPDAPLLLLIVVACVCGGWIGGAAAGAGFAVKLIPAVLGLLAPLERNWRGLVAFLASAGLLIAIPWTVVAFLRGPVRPATTDYLFGTPCVLSWSFPSAALRLIEPPGPDGKLPSDWLIGWDLARQHLSARQKRVSISVAVAILAAGLALLWIRTHGRLDPEQAPIAGTALVALALAASPIGWWHYQVLQYPGVALVFSYAIRRRDWRRLSAYLVCAALLFPVPAIVLRHYVAVHRRWPDAPVVSFWTAVTPLASLFLFGSLVSYLAPSARGTTGESPYPRSFRAAP